MDDSFTALRDTIYKTEDERKRFRQLVVNGKLMPVVLILQI